MFACLTILFGMKGASRGLQSSEERCVGEDGQDGLYLDKQSILIPYD